MNIDNPDYLATFHARTRCEYCRRSCQGTDPHHVVYRSHGGGDHPLNVIGLCRGFGPRGWKSCHDEAHRGEIHKTDLWAMLARARQSWARIGNPRLVLTGADCEAVCRMVARLVKPMPHEVEAALAELSPTQRELALAIEEVREARGTNANS